jgi:hypothetical protein
MGEGLINQNVTCHFLVHFWTKFSTKIYVFCKMKNVTSHRGSKPVSPNDTWVGNGSKIGQKKCYVLFEWPLRVFLRVSNLFYGTHSFVEVQKRKTVFWNNDSSNIFHNDFTTYVQQTSTFFQHPLKSLLMRFKGKSKAWKDDKLECCSRKQSYWREVVLE